MRCQLLFVNALGTMPLAWLMRWGSMHCISHSYGITFHRNYPSIYGTGESVGAGKCWPQDFKSLDIRKGRQTGSTVIYTVHSHFAYCDAVFQHCIFWTNCYVPFVIVSPHVDTDQSESPHHCYPLLWCWSNE